MPKLVAKSLSMRGDVKIQIVIDDNGTAQSEG